LFTGETLVVEVVASTLIVSIDWSCTTVDNDVADARIFVNSVVELALREIGVCEFATERADESSERVCSSLARLIEVVILLTDVSEPVLREVAGSAVEIVSLRIALSTALLTLVLASALVVTVVISDASDTTVLLSVCIESAAAGETIGFSTDDVCCTESKSALDVIVSVARSLLNVNCALRNTSVIVGLGIETSWLALPSVVDVVVELVL